MTANKARQLTKKAIDNQEKWTFLDWLDYRIIMNLIRKEAKKGNYCLQFSWGKIHFEEIRLTPYIKRKLRKAGFIISNSGFSSELYKISWDEKDIPIPSIQ